MRKFTSVSKSFSISCVLILFASFLIASCSSNILNRNQRADARKLLLRDEGLSQLSYVDLASPDKSWFVPVPVGRDMQLVGNGRVLIGTSDGYQEHTISNGEKVFEIKAFPGTQTARRLRNGNTLLAGANWQGKEGIVLVQVGNSGQVSQILSFPGFSYVRCIRETVSGNLLVTADDLIFEADLSGKIVWRAKVSGPPVKPHVWQAVRLGNGNTVASSGYAKNFQVFDAEGKQISVFSGPEEVKPNFYAGFQVLSNGNYVVTNWQGHGPNFGSSGSQVLEYSPSGDLVWQWKQDPKKFSSLQGIIVLDGLDLSRLHVEDKNGVLKPVTAKNER